MVTREMIERTQDSVIRLAGGWGYGDLRQICDLAEAVIEGREALAWAHGELAERAGYATDLARILALVPASEDTG